MFCTKQDLHKSPGSVVQHLLLHRMYECRQNTKRLCGNRLFFFQVLLVEECFVGMGYCAGGGNISSDDDKLFW
jgi:hypothetical protein